MRPVRGARNGDSPSHVPAALEREGAGYVVVDPSTWREDDIDAYERVIGTKFRGHLVDMLSSERPGEG